MGRQAAGYTCPRGLTCGEQQANSVTDKTQHTKTTLRIHGPHRKEILPSRCNAAWCVRVALYAMQFEKNSTRAGCHVAGLTYKQQQRKRSLESSCTAYIETGKGTSSTATRCEHLLLLSKRHVSAQTTTCSPNKTPGTNC